MTDIEICKLCAMAKGFTLVAMEDYGAGHAWRVCRYEHGYNAVHSIITDGEYVPSIKTYSPLTDRAQAMDLVMHFHMRIDYNTPDALYIVYERSIKESSFKTKDADLLRAICLCVAKVQKAKVAK